MFGLAVLVTAAAPTAPLAAGALVVVGATSIAFLTTGNTTLQLAADPRFRGRVMALWAVAFLGSTPLGAPVIGAVSEHISPRGGLLVGGLACLTAAAIGALAQSRERHRARTGEAPA
jgi:MFS family permease